MKRAGGLLLYGLMAVAAVSAHAADMWGFVPTVSPSTTYSANRLCYTDGRDIACDAAAGLLTTSGTLYVPIAVSATNLYARAASFTTLTVGGVAVTVGGGDRIVSTSANVVAYAGGTVSITTGGVSGTAYFDTAGRLVVPGISTTTAQASFTTIYTSGNVGIGTSAPAQKLDVNGGIQLKDTLIFTAAGTLQKPNTPVTGFAFLNAGSVDANNPFWSGYHWTTADPIVVGGTMGFPRVSMFWNYNSATDPTNLTFNYFAGNNAPGGVANLLFGTDTAGVIRFFTAGADRMRITGTGNVGMGTSNPNAKLDVMGTVSATNFTGNGSGLTGVSAAPAGPSGSIQFNLNGTSVSGSNAFVIQNGNVGIGSTAPATKLDIVGGNSSGDTTTGGLISFEYAGTGYRHRITTSHDAGSAVGNTMSFYLWNYGTDAAGALGTKQVITLRGDGNVGIGTTGPGVKLHVYGTGDQRIKVENDGTASAVFEAKSGTNSSYLFTNTTGDLRMYPGSQLGITILLSNGNVGIGTTSPGSSAKLEVSSTTQGFLPPRLTKAQRNAIASPAVGLMIYQTEDKRIEWFDGTNWATFSGTQVAFYTNCADGPIGSECADGSVYAGLTPDGNVPMYTTRCDAGKSWNGSACTGTASYMVWYTSGVNVAGTTNCATAGACPDTGEADTAAIVSELGSGAAAAYYCDTLTENGKSDWYLPAFSELSVLYTNHTAIGNFAAATFWSTSEYSASNVWYKNFANGTTAGSAKTNALNVRCVRK